MCSQVFDVTIIDPHIHLQRPYIFLPNNYGQLHIRSIKLGLQSLNHYIPDLIFLSASFDAQEQIFFLQQLKQFCYSNQKDCTPLIMVIDFDHRLNFIPGINWNNKIAILDSFANKLDVLQTIQRVLL